MTQFLELCVSGLSLGCVYGLVALGFVAVFKATHVVNFAHGSILLLGAYVIARLQPDLGFVAAVLGGVAAAAGAAVLVEVLLVRRLKGADPGTLAILTIGVNVLLATELTRRIGSDVLPLGDPWRDKVVEVAGLHIPQARVAAAIVALLLLGAFGAVLKLTDWGVAMRCAADDGRTAALMGIRLNRVSAAAWALAGGLAAIGGLFFTTFPTPGVDANVGLFALAAFPAAIIGGLDSLRGAVAGGLIVGLVVTLVAGYQDELAFLGRGFSSAAPYVVMVLVLLARPAGLFGRPEVVRV